MQCDRFITLPSASHTDYLQFVLTSLSLLVCTCGSSIDSHISCRQHTTHPQATIYGNPFVSVHDRQAHSGPRKGWIHLEVHQERVHCITITGPCMHFLHSKPVYPSFGIYCGVVY